MLAAVHKIQEAWLDPHLGVEIGRFRGGDGVGLGIRGWRLVGLGVEMGWV